MVSHCRKLRKKLNGAVLLSFNTSNSLRLHEQDGQYDVDATLNVALLLHLKCYKEKSLTINNGCNSLVDRMWSSARCGLSSIPDIVRHSFSDGEGY